MFFAFGNESRCAVAVCGPAIRCGPDEKSGAAAAVGFMIRSLFS